MKIILESELEKCAWEIMMAAQYKWERNYGSSMCDYFDYYLKDIYKEEADQAVKDEAESRLRDKFGEEFFVGKDEYVKSELEGYAPDELIDEEKQELEQGLCEDYDHVWEQIEDEREYLMEDVRQKLRGIYYTFFNGPQRLTVIYNDEVIQGEGVKENNNG